MWWLRETNTFYGTSCRTRTRVVTELHSEDFAWCRALAPTLVTNRTKKERRSAALLAHLYATLYVA